MSRDVFRDALCAVCFASYESPHPYTPLSNRPDWPPFRGTWHVALPAFRGDKPFACERRTHRESRESSLPRHMSPLSCKIAHDEPEAETSHGGMVSNPWLQHLRLAALPVHDFERVPREQCFEHPASHHQRCSSLVFHVPRHQALQEPA